MNKRKLLDEAKPHRIRRFFRAVEWYNFELTRTDVWRWVVVVEE